MNKQHPNSPTEIKRSEYRNTDWPRDFDFRIEVAEQKEVIEQPIPQQSECSEYDY